VPGLAHGGGLQPDLELDVERTVLAVGGRIEVRQRRRIALGPWKGRRKGASASIVTIHGESVLAKFFDRKGPSGWYSQPWMSRALQSLNSAIPKTWSSALAMGTGTPAALPVPMKTPSSSS
jgi:hypothetical protein